MQGLYFCLSCLFFIVFLSILNVDAVKVRGRLKLSNKWIELSGHKKISPLTLLQVDRTEAKKGGKGGSSRRRREAQDKQKKRAEQDGKRNEQKTKANQRAEQDTKVRQQQQEQRTKHIEMKHKQAEVNVYQNSKPIFVKLFYHDALIHVNHYNRVNLVVKIYKKNVFQQT